MRRSEAAAAELLRACRSWSELRARLAVLDERSKGSCFELLTEHFLRLSPVHRTQLRHVWSVGRRDVPRRVREHVGLPGLDEGIDLVAETVDGRYWAIQCKYHQDERHSLTYARKYRTFRSARAYVRSLGLASQSEWTAYIKSGRKPDDIPAAPWQVYESAGWAGTRDWLGTGRKRPVQRMDSPGAAHEKR